MGTSVCRRDSDYRHGEALSLFIATLLVAGLHQISVGLRSLTDARRKISWVLRTLGEERDTWETIGYLSGHLSSTVHQGITARSLLYQIMMDGIWSSN